MSRATPFFIASLLFIVCFTAASSAQTSWPQIKDNEGGFIIRFPGQPIYQTTADPVTGNQVEIYKFFYTGRLLRITFAPLPVSDEGDKPQISYSYYM